jgi:hypothetical protein
MFLELVGIGIGIAIIATWFTLKEKQEEEKNNE